LNGPSVNSAPRFKLGGFRELFSLHRYAVKQNIQLPPLHLRNNFAKLEGCLNLVSIGFWNFSK
jgi:hypothetical protein